MIEIFSYPFLTMVSGRQRKNALFTFHSSKVDKGVIVFPFSKNEVEMLYVSREYTMYALCLSFEVFPSCAPL